MKKSNSQIKSGDPCLERIEIHFSSQGCGLREARFWKSVLAEARLTASRVERSKHGYDIRLLSRGGALLVADQHLVWTSVGSQTSALDGALALLWRMPDQRVESLIYQLRGPDAGASRAFKDALMRLRSEAGDRLGALVVSDGTALFHPPPQRPRLMPSHVTIQLSLQHLAPRVELALRAAAAERGVLDPSRFGLEPWLEDGVSSRWSKNGEIITLVANSRLWRGSWSFQLAPQASFAVFEYSGAAEAKLLGPALERVITAFAPRSFHVEALHAGASACLPSIGGGDWQPHPMGASDARSVLEFRSARGASA